MPVLAGEIVDATFMSTAALRAFYAEQIDAARTQGLLLSLHLKATMMKVSDPVIFGHAVTVFFEPVFTKHADTFAQLGVNPNHRPGRSAGQLDTLPPRTRPQIRADIARLYAERPALAMVDSDRGITNLHVPNDVIIDASHARGDPRRRQDVEQSRSKLQDTLAMMPDRCYGPIYRGRGRGLQEERSSSIRPRWAPCPTSA